MKYSIAPEVAAMFPTFVRGVVVALGIDNRGQSEEIDALLREAEARVRQDTGLTEITTHPRVSNWRAAFNAFGVKPAKFPPSIEALVRRVRKGNSLPRINKMVDFCNAISLKHLVPIGAHALDDCIGDLSIRVARGDEPFSPLGSAEVEHPDGGEIILCDDAHALTRRWIWRQAEQTKTAVETTKIEINVDGLTPVERAEIEAIMVKVAELVVRHFKPRSVGCHVLDAGHPWIQFEV